MKTRYSFTNLLGSLALGWLAISLPLSLLVYFYINHNLKREVIELRNSQEAILLDMFEQSARYGDLVNAKMNIEALGKTFGLRRLLACRDGVDVIGGMIPITCPPASSGKDIENLGNKINIHFDWQPEGLDSFNPVIIRAIAVTCALSFITFLIIGTFVYQLLTRKIASLSSRIAKEDDDKFEKIEVDLVELEPVAEALFRLRIRLAENLARVTHLQTAEALGRLSRQVAHDIRSPLSALSIVARKSQIGDPDSLLLIDSAVKRIESIANDLLKAETVPSPSGLTGFSDFDQFVKMKQAEAGDAARINLSFQLSKPVILPLDFNNLSRILSNLVNNAIEARNPKRACVVNIRVTQASEEQIEIEISDNGKGIREADLALLNTSPRSLAKTEPGSGFGMGLAHAKRLLESVGGGLTITSPAGSGTQVVVRLPFNR